MQRYALPRCVTTYPGKRVMLSSGGQFNGEIGPLADWLACEKSPNILGTGGGGGGQGAVGVSVLQRRSLGLDLK